MPRFWLRWEATQKPERTMPTDDELREAAAQHTWRADELRAQADTHDRSAARLLSQASGESSDSEGGSENG